MSHGDGAEAGAVEEEQPTMTPDEYEQSPTAKPDEHDQEAALNPGQDEQESAAKSEEEEAAEEEPELKLEDDQIMELLEIFRSFDVNKDGSLTQPELGELLGFLGLHPSTDQLVSLLKRADTNANGVIEFSEFVSLVEPEIVHSRSPYTDEQLRFLFNIFDRDGNGFITAAELTHSMANLGHALTVEELTGMIQEADTDGDGQISYQEFCIAISSAAFDYAWF